MVRHDTGQKGRGPGGCQQRTTGEFCGRNEAHSETQPSWITNFCRLCDLRSREVCLSRAPKDFAGLTAVEPGGHPADGHVAVNLCESTLMDQTVSILIFHRLTLTISSVRCVIGRSEAGFLEETIDRSSFALRPLACWLSLTRRYRARYRAYSALLGWRT
jgi:hypothetical protein